MPEIQVVHDALAHYMSKPGISKDVAELRRSADFLVRNNSHGSAVYPSGL
jgi:hypothetical protein